MRILLTLTANLDPSSSTPVELSKIPVGNASESVFTDFPKEAVIQSLTPTIPYLLQDKNNRKNLATQSP